MGPRRWDIFIAHAAADTPTAEQLFDLLAGSASVFLDTRSLELGDNWDHALATAQRDSRLTIVLVSENSDAAYYQRVEVATAINQSRSPNDDHRVVPVYLTPKAAEGAAAQYGLNLKHGLFLSDRVTLEVAAYRLLSLLKRLQYRHTLFDSQQGAASHFRGHANSFWMSGKT